MATENEAWRTWHIRLTNLREELLAPANALRSYAELLHDETGSDGHDGIVTDLARIRTSGQALYDLVERLLDPNLARDIFEGTDVVAAKRRLRHDIRTPITAIKGYGELLLEEASGKDADPLRGQLMRLMTEASRLLAQLDAIVEFHTTTTMSNDLVRSFARASQAENETVKPGRILVVDDNETNRDLLARRLVQEGHEVLLAEHGAVAFAVLKRETVDLILLDLLMPIMNGLEVLLALKDDDRLRDIPVIIVSAIDETDSIIRCIEAGAEDYLPKQFEPALLRARINACLKRKRWRERELPEDFEANVLAANAIEAVTPTAEALDDSALSARDLELKQELEAVLRAAVALVARNQQLTSRSVARVLAETGKHRFKERTLRKIVDHRYPSLHRLGILNEPRT